MESRDRSSLIRRRLLGVSGIVFVVGALFGLLGGDYWFALSQIAFAAAMALIFFRAEEKGGAFVYLTYACFVIALLMTVIATSV